MRFTIELNEKKQIILYAAHLATRYKAEDVMLIFNDFTY